MDARGQHRPREWIKVEGFVQPGRHTGKRGGGVCHLLRVGRALHRDPHGPGEPDPARVPPEQDKRDPATWVRKPLSPKTLANVHGMLYAVFQHAVEAQPPRVGNPCARTRLPRTDDPIEDEMTFPEREEDEVLRTWLAAICEGTPWTCATSWRRPASGGPVSRVAPSLHCPHRVCAGPVLPPLASTTAEPSPSSL